MKVNLHVWRQKGPSQPGRMETYETPELNPDMSFLEMLDVLNDSLVAKGGDPIAFDHDCREGICGSCSLMINGRAHGTQGHGGTACQLYMRQFKNGDHIYVEPWRARAFPILRDLVVDRSAFDRIMQAGGYISVNTGGAPDGNSVPVPKQSQEQAMDAAECIGCGACVAACKNASAMLFVSAKVSHLGILPQGQPERYERVRRMVDQMDAEGFGSCTNYGECSAACPKEIPQKYIARMNRDYLQASLRNSEEEK